MSETRRGEGVMIDPGLVGYTLIAGMCLAPLLAVVGYVAWRDRREGV